MNEAVKKRYERALRCEPVARLRFKGATPQRRLPRPPSFRRPVRIREESERHMSRFLPASAHKKNFRAWSFQGVPNVGTFLALYQGKEAFGRD